MKKSRRHALGQHFLASRSILQRIVDVIDPRDTDAIIEIGAGKGILTFALLAKAGNVTAIEKDPALVAILEKTDAPRLTVLAADVLDLDFRDVLKSSGTVCGQAKLVGNLPYSISSPILFKTLDAKDLFFKCVFLIQREVAERVCARPGSKSYAPLSILIQNEFAVRIEFLVAPGCFSPPPRVDSAVLSLTRRDQALHDFRRPSSFRTFLWSAFAHRRKLLSKNLEMSGIPRFRIEEIFRILDLPKTSRAEELSIARFAALYQALHNGRRRSG